MKIALIKSIYSMTSIQNKVKILKQNTNVFGWTQLFVTLNHHQSSYEHIISEHTLINVYMIFNGLLKMEIHLLLYENGIIFCYIYAHT